MTFFASISQPVLKRKCITLLLVGISIASFGSLIDPGKKKAVSSKNFLSAKSAVLANKTFSLKSGYDYRGNAFLKPNGKEHFMMVNTVITYQKGNTTYIMPLKKKLLLDKVSFKPDPLVKR